MFTNSGGVVLQNPNCGLIPAHSVFMLQNPNWSDPCTLYVCIAESCGLTPAHFISVLLNPNCDLTPAHHVFMLHNPNCGLTPAHYVDITEPYMDECGTGSCW